MAEEAAVTTSINGGDAVSVLWSNLGTNDTGAAVQLPRHGAISIQVGGTFNSSTIVIEGSNDGSTWTTLIDMQGSNMSFTAAAFKTLRDVPRYIRPSCTGGTATALWVSLYARRTC